MKKYITYYLIIVALIAGCKKDKTTNQDKKLYPVTFTVSGLNQIARTTSANGKLIVNALPDSTQKFYYIVLGVKTYFQTSAVPGFGIIHDSLPAGDYTLAFIQSRGNLKLASSSFTADSDVFFKRLPITVTNSPIDGNVTLNRINGKLEVNIEDAIPANVSSISVTVANDVNDFAINQNAKPQKIRTTVFTKTIKSSDIGKTNIKLSGPIFNVSTPFSVVIKATGINTIYVPKTVNNVTCAANTKTILSGKLFEAPESSFDITVDKGFDADTIKTGL